jgi:hypothetical protein
MKEYYITSDKVGEFVQRMYEKGIRVDAEPEDNRLSVYKPVCGLEFIKVYEKGSFESLVAMFDNQ